MTIAKKSPFKHSVDKAELQNAQKLWDSFTKVSTYVVVIIAVVLALMALFLT